MGVLTSMKSALHGRRRFRSSLVLTRQGGKQAARQLVVGTLGSTWEGERRASQAPVQACSAGDRGAMRLRGDLARHAVSERERSMRRRGRRRCRCCGVRINGEELTAVLGLGYLLFLAQ